MPRTHTVFVYGTLMRGEHHHDVLKGRRFVDEGTTQPAYELVWMEYYPALIEGGTQAVRGEIYEVDDAGLAALDALEEHPSFYIRTQTTLKGGREVTVYVLPRERAEGAQRIVSGYFRDLPRARRQPT